MVFDNRSGLRYLLSVSETNWLAEVRFGADGLVPVVAQESRSGDVLMLAYANREALERTAATGRAHYYSRSRAALWRKGETSGHEQTPRADRSPDPDRLRRRRDPLPGRPDRARLPHRHPDLLLGGRGAGRQYDVG
jgi:phosphoribosyl-AMP cyclohydrolase